MVTLSVVILSYNTRSLTENCLTTLFKNLSQSPLESEVIVIDNASDDDSQSILDAMKKKAPDNVNMVLIKNKQNIGYPKGNNQGIATASGTYILLLNSDTTIDHVDFQAITHYMDQNPNVGVLTVQVLLPNRSIDPASHRGFPTPWNAFCYFSKLEKILGKGFLGRFFGGYHLTSLDLKTIHEIDSPSGAFYLTRKDVLQKVNGFDENFFMYGEDLDLSYRIKKLGYKIIYYPAYTITHYKHKSGLKSDNKHVKQRVRGNFFEAMKIFYKKHYEKLYPA